MAKRKSSSSSSNGTGLTSTSDPTPGVPDVSDVPVPMTEVDINDPQLQALASELRSLEQNLFLARTSFARATGFTFDNRRDVYGILGRRDLISTSDYRAKYQRGGIAGRIVDAMPNACWRGEMELIEDESKETFTPFEQAWANLDQRLQIKAKFQRVDKLAGLSTYAVLLIGHTDGLLDQELPKQTYSTAVTQRLAYLRPFVGGGGPTQRQNYQADKAIATGSDATIEQYDVDPASKRFGMPMTYRIKGVGLDGQAKPVHWSRILHIAEGLLDDEVFGLPSLERVWNDLEDLEKVSGGGSEAFWLRANQGVHVNIEKDMILANEKNTMAALREQVEAYKHNLDRFIRTRGTDIKVLGSDVANFAGPVDTILTLIAGAKGMPKRILTGSEMGELASSQDRDNWKDQVNGRQTGYLGPYLVRPFVDRLIEYGYLPTPTAKKDSPSAYEVKWPHIQTLTEEEKAAGAEHWANVNKTMGEIVFKNDEIRDKWYGMAPLKPAEKIPVAAPVRETAVATDNPDAASKPQPQPKPQSTPLPPKLVKAAQEYVPQDGDSELVIILAEALEAGNAAVVASIVGLSILPMHFGVPGGSTRCGQPATDQWITEDESDVTCVKCVELIRADDGHVND